MTQPATSPLERARGRVEALARRVAAFRRLNGGELRLFVVAALRPYPVSLKELLATLRRLDLYGALGRSTTDAQIERWLESWSKVGLLHFDGKRLECDIDFGTYVCRHAAETPLGDFVRQSPSVDRELWRSEDGSDPFAYAARLSRFTQYPSRTEHFLREWLTVGGRGRRLAALYGPGDPFFIPHVLDHWTSALPRLSLLATQQFQDTSWHVAFYDALVNRDAKAGSGLLLDEDHAHFDELAERALTTGLLKSHEYQSLDYCARLTWGLKSEVRERATRPSEAQNPIAQAALGVLALCEGTVPDCLNAFQRAHRLLKGKGGDRLTFGWFGVFELLALLIQRDRESVEQARKVLTKLLGKSKTHREVDDLLALLRLAAFYEFCTNQPVALAPTAEPPKETPLSLLLGGMMQVWTDAPPKSLDPWLKHCKALREEAERSGAVFYVEEIGPTIERLEHPSVRGTTRSLVDLITVKAPWELMLESLARFAEGGERQSVRPAATETPSRVVWFVQLYGEHLAIEPRLQSKKGSGFSRGRPIALKRLATPRDETLPLSDADRKLADHVVSYNPYYGAMEYRFDERAALDLIGHPFVYAQEDESLHYDVKRGQIWLRHEQNGAGEYLLSLEPAIYPVLQQMGGTAETLVRRQGSELTVFELTKELKRLSQLIGPECKLPKEASGQLAALLPTLSALVPTRGELLSGTDDHHESGDTLPVLRIKPRPGALRVQLLVTPFGPEGPAETPGEGSELVADYQGGRSRQVLRNLSEELERVETLLASLPELDPGLDGSVWKVEGASACLELIAALARVDEGTARVEWPEGQPFKLKQVRELRVQVTGGDAKRWFELEGELRLSDDSLMSVAELLALLKRREGRFIQLKSGDYAELTEDALTKLQLLEAFRIKTDKHAEPSSVQIAPWLAFALPEGDQLLSPQASHEAWQAWRKRVSQVSVKQPGLPKGFRGTLRDYQLEGYRWLCRAAELDLGVCLADDMGLGKTVQALALLEHRATRKLAVKQDARPMLIVAPASVCPNWLAEAERFTKNLELRWHTGAERHLDGLGRKTVVVCTYDVLYRDHVELTQIVWDTVILDEAQQIKNAHTHRARTAFALKANFRLAMSGTPIENHLGELWSLYRFLMPGLLAEQHEFVERFRNPIENQKDDERRRQLQALIRPFLLRRTKAQVLSELPSRTELVRKIPLSEPELSLYEALRLRGLESLNSPAKDKNQQRVRVLAEITRLRRACCHPRLVLEDSEIASSKLATLLELVAELRDAGHRALVFSQFVDHLSLVREALDDEGIAYQYLDGSTPMAERARRVSAFQQGEGELFLISLKAGGTGLNLTAADYVLHLDPWWNPAVEDQASDRAHRIGQERPVTIYRLVAEGTIEEKLVHLHGQKRALAADILAESSERKSFDPDELMALLRDSAVGSIPQGEKKAARKR